MKKIAGAGIAGLVCAIKLKKLGHEVLVLEKRDKVGSRFSGDFQGIENWGSRDNFADSLHSLGVDLNQIAVTKGDKVTVIGPKNKVYSIKSVQPMFYLVKRGSEEDSLDNYLYSIAKRAGVKFKFSSPIENADEADIIATGPNASLSTGFVIGINFKTNLNDGIWLHIDTSRNKSGYNYLIVINQTATLAMAAKSKLAGKKDIEIALSFFQRFIGGFNMENVKSFSGHSVSDHIRLSDQKIIIGEAAGFQDHLLGFGMRYAIESALLAADCLSAKRYNEKAGAQIVPGIKKTIFWRKIIYGFAGNPAIIIWCKAAKINPRGVLRFLYRGR